MDLWLHLYTAMFTSLLKNFLCFLFTLQHGFVYTNKLGYSITADKDVAQGVMITSATLLAPPVTETTKGMVCLLCNHTVYQCFDSMCVCFDKQLNKQLHKMKYLWNMTPSFCCTIKLSPLLIVIWYSIKFSDA